MSGALGLLQKMKSAAFESTAPSQAAYSTEAVMGRVTGKPQLHRARTVVGEGGIKGVPGAKEQRVQGGKE